MDGICGDGSTQFAALFFLELEADRLSVHHRNLALDAPATSAGLDLSVVGEWGVSVAALGDADGNGVPDALVSGSWASDATAGFVDALFLGLDDGVVTIVAAVRVDGAIGSPLAGSGVQFTGSNFGASVTAIGSARLVVAAPAARCVYVVHFKVPPSTSSLTFSHSPVELSASTAGDVGRLDDNTKESLDGLGRAVASIGDVSGDGKDDLLVSTMVATLQGEGAADANYGGVYVLATLENGGVNQLAVMPDDIIGGSKLPLVRHQALGSALAAMRPRGSHPSPMAAIGAAGDGSAAAPEHGSVVIVTISAEVVVTSVLVISGGSFPGVGDTKTFGSAVAAVDTDADGCEELVVGSAASDAGVVIVWIGPVSDDEPHEMQYEAHVVLSRIDVGIPANEAFGSAIATLASSSRWAPAELAISTGETLSVVHVWTHDRSSVRVAAAVTLSNPSGSAPWGDAVASVGDLDGDGRDDMAVSSATAGFVDIVFLRRDGMGMKDYVRVDGRVGGALRLPHVAESGSFGLALCRVEAAATDVATFVIGDPFDSTGVVWLVQLEPTLRTWSLPDGGGVEVDMELVGAGPVVGGRPAVISRSCAAGCGGDCHGPLATQCDGSCAVGYQRTPDTFEACCPAPVGRTPYWSELNGCGLCPEGCAICGGDDGECWLCPDGHWLSHGQCEPAVSCAINEYVVRQPTRNSDRECGPCHDSCVAGAGCSGPSPLECQPVLLTDMSDGSGVQALVVAPDDVWGIDLNPLWGRPRLVIRLPGNQSPVSAIVMATTASGLVVTEDSVLWLFCEVSLDSTVDADEGLKVGSLPWIPFDAQPVYGLHGNTASDVGLLLAAGAINTVASGTISSWLPPRAAATAVAIDAFEGVLYAAVGFRPESSLLAVADVSTGLGAQPLASVSSHIIGLAMDPFRRMLLWTEDEGSVKRVSVDDLSAVEVLESGAAAVGGASTVQSGHMFAALPSTVSLPPPVVLRCAPDALKLHAANAGGGALPAGLVTTSTDVGEAVAFADFNSDGVTDVILGLPTFDETSEGLHDVGALLALRLTAGLDGIRSVHSYRLLRISSSDVSAALDATTLVPERSSELGTSVAAMDDVGGDTNTYVVTGLPGHGDGKGAVIILSMTFTTNLYVSSAATVDTSDVSLAVGDRFGQSVAFIPDVNDDGALDIVVGAPGTGSAGAVYIVMIHPSTGGVLFAERIHQPADQRLDLGLALACLGDITGDGSPEIAVGTGSSAVVILSLPERQQGLPVQAYWQDSASVLRMLDNGDASLARAGLVLTGPEEFGKAVAAGRLDSDGGHSVPELFVGMPGVDTVAVLFFHDDATASVRSVMLLDQQGRASALPAHVQGLLAALDFQGIGRFGSSVAVSATRDADGSGSVAVGSVGFYDGTPAASTPGGVFVLRTLPVTSPRPPPFAFKRHFVEISPYTEGAPGGIAEMTLSLMSNAGDLSPLDDVNGDGFADLAVGMPGRGTGDYQHSGGALILSLRTDGSVIHQTTLDRTTLAGVLAPRELQRDDRFGTAVAGISDVNEDGFPELLVSAPEWRRSESAGALYVISLAANGEAAAATLVVDGWAGGLPAGTLEGVERFGVSLEAFDSFPSPPARRVVAVGCSVSDPSVAAPVIVLEFEASDGAVVVAAARRLGAASDLLDSGASLVDAGRGILGVGAPFESLSDGDEYSGAVYLLEVAASVSVSTVRKIDPFSGTLSTASVSGQPITGGLFGRAMCNLGDLDGDGGDDILVSMPRVGMLALIFVDPDDLHAEFRSLLIDRALQGAVFPRDAKSSMLPMYDGGRYLASLAGGRVAIAAPLFPTTVDDINGTGGVWLFSVAGGSGVLIVDESGARSDLRFPVSSSAVGTAITAVSHDCYPGCGVGCDGPLPTDCARGVCKAGYLQAGVFNESDPAAVACCSESASVNGSAVWYDTVSGECNACHFTCESCRGGSEYDCTACAVGFAGLSSGVSAGCVPVASCDPAVEFTVNTGSGVACEVCHSSCMQGAGCTGPSSADCRTPLLSVRGYTELVWVDVAASTEEAFVVARLNNNSSPVAGMATLTTTGSSGAVVLTKDATLWRASFSSLVDAAAHPVDAVGLAGGIMSVYAPARALLVDGEASVAYVATARGGVLQVHLDDGSLHGVVIAAAEYVYEMAVDPLSGYLYAAGVRGLLRTSYRSGLGLIIVDEGVRDVLSLAVDIEHERLVYATSAGLWVRGLTAGAEAVRVADVQRGNFVTMRHQAGPDSGVTATVVSGSTVVRSPGTAARFNATPAVVFNSTAMSGTEWEPGLFVTSTPFGGAGRVVVAGDIDGNGCDDWILGRPNATIGGATIAGDVTMVMLGDTQCDTITDVAAISSLAGNLSSAAVGMFDSPQDAQGYLLGYALAALGDWNGDAVPDVAVSAPGAPAGGAVFVLMLNQSGGVASATVISNSTTELVGDVLSSVGTMGSSMTAFDVDADAGMRPELFVGVNDDDVVLVMFLAGADAHVDRIVMLSRALHPTFIPGALDFPALSSIEVNGDGRRDLVLVTTDSSLTATINILVFDRSAGIIEASEVRGTSPELVSYGINASSTGWAWSTGSCEDLDGDGFEELLVGCRSDDDYMCNGFDMLFLSNGPSVAVRNAIHIGGDYFGVYDGSHFGSSVVGLPGGIIVGAEWLGSTGSTRMGGVYRLSLASAQQAPPVAFARTQVVVIDEATLKLTASAAPHFQQAVASMKIDDRAISIIGSNESVGLVDIDDEGRVVRSKQVEQSNIHFATAAYPIGTGPSAKFGASVSGFAVGMRHEARPAILVGATGTQGCGTLLPVGAVWIVEIDENLDTTAVNRVSACSGGVALGLEINALFGYGVAGRDLNGDGVMDFVASAPGMAALFTVIMNADMTYASHLRLRAAVDFNYLDWSDSAAFGYSSLALLSPTSAGTVLVTGAPLDSGVLGEGSGANLGAVVLVHIDDAGAVVGSAKFGAHNGGAALDELGLVPQTFWGGSVAAVDDLDGDRLDELVVTAAPNGGLAACRIDFLFMNEDMLSVRAATSVRCSPPSAMPPALLDMAKAGQVIASVAPLPPAQSNGQRRLMLGTSVGGERVVVLWFAHAAALVTVDVTGPPVLDGHAVVVSGSAPELAMLQGAAADPVRPLCPDGCASGCAVTDDLSTRCVSDACAFGYEVAQDGSDACCPTPSGAAAAYFDVEADECRQCAAGCASCRHHNASFAICTSCVPGFWLSDGVCEAWTECDSESEFVAVPPSNLSDTMCSPCNDACLAGIGCSGPEPQDCRVVFLTARGPNDVFWMTGDGKLLPAARIETTSADIVALHADLRVGSTAAYALTDDNQIWLLSNLEVTDHAPQSTIRLVADLSDVVGSPTSLTVDTRAAVAYVIVDAELFKVDLRGGSIRQLPGDDGAVAAYVDALHGRLFVAFASGAVASFDSETGLAMQAFADAGGMPRAIVYDEAHSTIWTAHASGMHMQSSTGEFSASVAGFSDVRALAMSDAVYASDVGLSAEPFDNTFVAIDPPTDLFFSTASKRQVAGDGNGIALINDISQPVDGVSDLLLRSPFGLAVVLFVNRKYEVSGMREISGSVVSARVAPVSLQGLGSSVAGVLAQRGGAMSAIIGASSTDGDRGAVVLVRLATGGSLIRADALTMSDISGGLEEDALFGSAVAVFDNGDSGSAAITFAVGAPGVGSVFLFEVTDAGTIVWQTKISSEQVFGSAVPEFGHPLAAMGVDASGDSTTIFAVVRDAYLVSVKVNGLYDNATVANSATLCPSPSYEVPLTDFGRSIAVIGDLDGDGQQEVASARGGLVDILFLSDDLTTVLAVVTLGRDSWQVAIDYVVEALWGESLGWWPADGAHHGWLLVGAPKGANDNGLVSALSHVDREHPPVAFREDFRLLSESTRDEPGTLSPDSDAATWLLGGRGGVASIGDIDADGVPDMAIGIPRSSACLIVFLTDAVAVRDQLLISATGGGLPAAASPFAIEVGHEFGAAPTALAAVGGRVIAVGAPGDDAVWVMRLHVDGVVAEAARVAEGSAGGLPLGTLSGVSRFGAALAGLDTGALAVGSDGADKGDPDIFIITITDRLVYGGHTRLTAADYAGTSGTPVGFGYALCQLWVTPTRTTLAIGAPDANAVILADATGPAKVTLSPDAGLLDIIGLPISGSYDWGRSLALLSDLDGNGVAEVAVGSAANSGFIDVLYFDHAGADLFPTLRAATRISLGRFGPYPREFPEPSPELSLGESLVSVGSSTIAVSMQDAQSGQGGVYLLTWEDGPTVSSLLPGGKAVQAKLPPSRIDAGAALAVASRVCDTGCAIGCQGTGADLCDGSLCAAGFSLTSDGRSACCPTPSVPSRATFYRSVDGAAAECGECDDSCAACTGPGPVSCLICAEGYWWTGSLCVPHVDPCDSGREYVLRAPTAASTWACAGCNIACIDGAGCTGPAFSDCREATLAALDTSLVWIPSGAVAASLGAPIRDVEVTAHHTTLTAFALTDDGLVHAVNVTSGDGSHPVGSASVVANFSSQVSTVGGARAISVDTARGHVYAAVSGHLYRARLPFGAVEHVNAGDLVSEIHWNGSSAAGTLYSVAAESPSGLWSINARLTSTSVDSPSYSVVPGRTERPVSIALDSRGQLVWATPTALYETRPGDAFLATELARDVPGGVNAIASNGQDAILAAQRARPSASVSVHIMPAPYVEFSQDTEAAVPGPHLPPGFLQEGDQLGALGDSIAPIEDVDGNGANDLLIARSKRLDVTLLLMESDGDVLALHTFTATEVAALTATSLAGGFGTAVCSVGDYNGDGVAEFAVSSAASGESVQILFMNPSSGFALSHASRIDADTVFASLGVPAAAGFGSALAAADLDGDGLRELFVGVSGWDGDHGAVICVALNAGDGQLAADRTVLMAVSSVAAALGNSLAVPAVDLRPRFVAAAAQDWTTDDEIGRGAVLLLELDPIAKDGTVHQAHPLTSREGGVSQAGILLSDHDHWGNSVDFIDDLDNDGEPDLLVSCMVTESIDILFLEDMRVRASVRRATTRSGAFPLAVHIQALRLPGQFGASVSFVRGWEAGLVVSLSNTDANTTGMVFFLRVPDLAKARRPIAFGERVVELSLATQGQLGRLPTQTLKQGDRFGGEGNGIAFCPDLTGDGTADLLIGADETRVSSTPVAGAVHVLHLAVDADVVAIRTLSRASADIVGAAAPLDPPQGRFGSSVSAFWSDRDGNGWPEIAVGARSDNDEDGAVWLLSLGKDAAVVSVRKLARDGATDNLGPDVLEECMFGAALHVADVGKCVDQS